MSNDRRDQLASALDDTATGMWMRQQHGPGWGHNVADALLPTVDAMIRQAQAEALEAAFREDRTTVAKLSPVERLTCYLVKSEDLVIRAAALRQADR